MVGKNVGNFRNGPSFIMQPTASQSRKKGHRVQGSHTHLIALVELLKTSYLFNNSEMKVLENEDYVSKLK